MGRGAVLGFLISSAAFLAGCRIPALIAGDGYDDYGTYRNEIKPVHGEHVDVGYFPVAGQGEYATLTQINSKWELSQFAEQSPPLAPGHERIFIQRRSDNVLQLTPVFELPQEVHDGGQYFECEQTDRSYNPCNSKFTKGLTLLENKRELDRREIERAVNESGLIPKLKQEWLRQKHANELAQAEQKNAQDIANRLAKQRSNIAVHVTKVDNTPGLVTITTSQAESLAHNTATNTKTPKSFSVAVSFSDVVRWLSTATVTCSLVPDRPAYEIQNVTTTASSTLTVTAIVSHCAVSDPHPESFVANQPGHVVTARLDNFNPHGLSMLTLNNTSSSYVTVSSVSVYYFDKIAVLQKQVELPPASKEQVVVDTNLSVDSTAPALTMGSAALKTYHFGVAVKYSAGDASTKTLLSLINPTYKSAIAPQ